MATTRPVLDPKVDTLGVSYGRPNGHINGYHWSLRPHVRADKYLNKQLKQEQTETAEGAKRLKMAQDAVVALEAKVQEDARNAVMEKPKQDTVDTDQPATQPATKHKIIKAKRATKPKAAEHTNSRRGKEKGAKPR